MHSNPLTHVAALLMTANLINCAPVSSSTRQSRSTTASDPYTIPPQPFPSQSALSSASIDNPNTVTALYGSSSLIGYNSANPFATGSSNPRPPTSVTYASSQATDSTGISLDFSDVDIPQPIRGSNGGTDPGPKNVIYEKLNPDKHAPPDTDDGPVPNAQWPMGLSHVSYGKNRAGWSRQQNVDDLPAATSMAGVMMRLDTGGYRELHWHSTSEWALVLEGSVRIQAVNELGETYIDDLTAGDVWFFPAGVPHSLQGLGNGTEFLLVFDDGAFSDDATFLVSETFFRNPKSVLAKNLGIPLKALNEIPQDRLYIFNGTEAPTNISASNVTNSAGVAPPARAYSYHWSRQQPIEVSGGSVKLIDSSTFPVASNFAAALVRIKPGAMREIHWHLSSDEWNFFISGSARVTVYAAQAYSRTFDYHATDVGYIPAGDTHYIENIGDDDVVFLEVLQAPKFVDISLGQWFALTPVQTVMDHLNIPEEYVRQLSKEKQYVVAGNNESS